ncbi:hypothetical protein [Roseomonas haemaphysalidis]|uniref:Uncharacterized protein n=1 Tax=Roseomonas haemaphysalidis TaxID=2768162 RepID=A0ABS3KM22_9PROT|nr:hypothetical protein [Roseomonas haemaphysalidis]MBO1078499.1 hypothetical protein [Roseomonas haemaphysalidis]
MRIATLALSLATLVGAATPVLAQPGPQTPISQPPTASVPNPNSGTASSSTGLSRPGGNAGNSAAQPGPQSATPARPDTLTTEGPSLESQSVGPGARPDQTPPRR